jgi:hypothetical protein
MKPTMDDTLAWLRTLIGVGILFFLLCIMAEDRKHQTEVKGSLEKIEKILSSE